MSCKLRCPNCGTMCKEYGDEMKVANGTYIVIVSSDKNILKCSECNVENIVMNWEMMG